MTRKDDMETSQALERRPGQILERHDMAEDNTRRANLETACRGLRPTTGHYGCPMMMMMTFLCSEFRISTFLCEPCHRIHRHIIRGRYSCSHFNSMEKPTAAKLEVECIIQPPILPPSNRPEMIQRIERFIEALLFSRWL